MNPKICLAMGAVSGFLGVALGAFGAHALAGTLSDRSREIYQTAVQYQMFHSLALLGVGLWGAQNASHSVSVPGWAFSLGILLFSGSLYTLAVTDIRWLGAITPLGGVAFLIGWIFFAVLALRA